MQLETFLLASPHQISEEFVVLELILNPYRSQDIIYNTQKELN